jgi:hypothetical protein
MAITYFNSVAAPADNGSQAGPTVSVTPPGSMVAGDLVLLVAGYKAGTVTFSMSNTGGQTWTSETHGGGATSGVRIRLFWCRYNGTWSANPAVTITTGTLAMSVIMHVFRPTTGGNTWAVQNAIAVYDSSAFNPTNMSQMTLATGDLGFAAVCSNDDNTWTTHSQTVAGTAQYRNLQGNDISLTAQYRIESAGTPAAQSYNALQVANAADTWGGFVIGFRETSSGPQQYTLTAETGTYNQTGNATGLTAHRKVTAETGSYNQTGVDAQLSKGFKVTAEVGAYNLTGQNATLLAHRLLSSSVGSYAYTGYDAGLTKAFRITTEGGSYLLTGYDAALLAHRMLLADVGSYNHTGNSANLTAHRLLIAETGAYILTGYDATLTKTTVGAFYLTADSGAYLVTGNNAGLLAHRVIGLEQGEYTHTGNDATLLKISQYGLTADSGQYEITGNDMTPLRGYVLTVEHGQYVITGYDVSFGDAEYSITAKSIIRNLLTVESLIRQGIASKSIIRANITSKSIIHD